MKVSSILSCLVSSLALIAASKVDTSAQRDCTDSPPGWTDAVKNECAWYNEFPDLRCGNIASLFPRRGRTADNACCACDGGDLAPPVVDYNGRWYLQAVQQGSRWINVRNSKVMLGFRNSNAIIEIEGLISIFGGGEFILKSPSNGGALICIEDNGTVTARRGASFQDENCKFVITPKDQTGFRVHFTNPYTGYTIEPFFGNVVQSTDIENSGMADIELQPAGYSVKSLRSSSVE